MAQLSSDPVVDPLWYKDAIIYELHVKTFHDSDGDGIGDFRGLIEKLDYLQELGVTALWLLPFYPSPLRDDGYDIADFRNVNPAYGTMRDFRQLLRAAHLRGLRVITELVVNHTSDQHAWFRRARSAPPGSRWRNFYVWSDTTERYRDARIIFQDFEASNWAWDRVAGQYYWHRFYSHQPDLNDASADVRRLMTRTLEYWLDLGVDGLRLDAVPYLFEREGTMCENLPETHAFLRQLRSAVDRRFDGRMLLAEANQWPEDAAEYFGRGDECHMACHLPVAPRHAGPLLRGRDRDGGQRLSRRPRRRAYAHAVVGGPQRGIFARESAAALPAGDHRSGIPLRDGQRRDSVGKPAVTALVDAA